MALSNPWYIDAQARHQAATQRLLAFSAMEGMEGVLLSDHLRVLDLDTPGGAIQVMPGAYSVLARHLGGDFEAYVGKISEAQFVDVNPTDSSGSRTDLVILRIENPYVNGAGSWPQPPDPVDGPYAHIRVIENVPANTNHVSAWNNTWSAITLARITRPANTGIVQQSHIADLRALANPAAERIIIIENPPANPPPIASEVYTEASKMEISSGNQLARTQTSYKKFPSDVTWNVPIPSWAVGMDVFININPQVDDGHVWGEARLVIDGTPASMPTTMFDLNWSGSGPGPIQAPISVMGTCPILPAWRGKQKNMWVEMKMNDPPNHPGKLLSSLGSYAGILINFKKYPVYD